MAGRVLLTGGSGQLGQSILKLASPSAQCSWVAPTRYELDLSDENSVRRLLEGESWSAVVNCAAYTAVDAAESDAVAARAVNSNGPKYLAEACEVAGIPILHVSTDYVFDGRKSAPYVESDVANPLSVYGRTKLDGEELLAKAATRHLILRTAWVHSPYGSNFVRTMMRLARDRQSVRVVADQVGSPTYAPHLAEAIVQITRRVISNPQNVAWGIYNAAGTGETSWAGFAKEVFRHAKCHDLPVANVVRITSNDYPTAAPRPANSRLDCSALKSAFGLQLPSWKQGVKECISSIARSSL
ncbi:dTDP-4-dehydrorhamnose reductase [Tepidamorphus sp. 3E244]|uniref:dTDP-4-dehydrorhamnose reductase n=1 Tax=Tepidamorphus sp. 3E244 TaxID=3385498 RepID=UPI0038FC12CA